MGWKRRKSVVLFASGLPKNSGCRGANHFSSHWLCRRCRSFCQPLSARCSIGRPGPTAQGLHCISVSGLLVTMPESKQERFFALRQPLFLGRPLVERTGLQLLKTFLYENAITIREKPFLATLAKRVLFILTMLVPLICYSTVFLSLLKKIFGTITKYYCIGTTFWELSFDVPLLAPPPPQSFVSLSLYSF